MSEFDLIRRHFTRSAPNALLGVGDDAALMKVSCGMALAVSTDMLVCGTHFFADADPISLGHKTLAVNLSDLAAMGAVPRWATLAISMPEADNAWLAAFSSGFFALADRYGVDLVGGDTTRGPLNLCVTIFGEVDAQNALRRSGAKIGDEIWVSGKIGDAALALAHMQGRIALTAGEFAASSPSLHRPEPRVGLGRALCGVASGAIDLSDGLLSDLGHMLDSSAVGAEVELSALPVSDALRGRLDSDIGRQCALAGGDDYELCFTAPACNRGQVLDISARLGLQLTAIGRILPGSGCSVRDASGNSIDQKSGGYDHFR